MSLDTRQQALHNWLSSTLQKPFQLIPVVGDASFRRYFRVQLQDSSLIAMDSPPEKEDCKPFIQLAHRLGQLNLQVPQILAADENEGYLLISDLGDQLYHYNLNSENADSLYRNALRDLVIIHSDYRGAMDTLPAFGWQAMLNELTLFTEWFLQKYLELNLSENNLNLLQQTYNTLLKSATEQPQTFVHRDYHSRNLMILPDNQVGILDFQDAVIGPITYDLVSLIRDCYIDWPLAQVHTWALAFYHDLKQANIISDVDEKTFMRWFDLMGIQRHLKAIFIFARKYLRDNNDFYLQFIPRALNYVNEVCTHYPELNDFQQLMQKTILPAWQNRVPA